MWQVQSFLAKGGQISSLQEARHSQGEKLGLWTDLQCSPPAHRDISLPANAGEEYAKNTSGKQLPVSSSSLCLYYRKTTPKENGWKTGTLSLWGKLSTKRS